MRGLTERLPEVLAHAEAAGVGLMVSIGTRVKKFERLLRIAEENANVFCTVGTHPHHAHEEPDVTVAELVELAKHPKVVGIGEAGLDYHYDFSPREAQAQGFRVHIAAARETGLPLVIHSREAEADMASILEEEMKQGAFKPLLHCFTSQWSLPSAGWRLAPMFRSPASSPTRAPRICGPAAEVPLDRLLVETDAPYLAPVPLSRQNQRAGLCREDTRAVGGGQRCHAGGHGARRRMTISSGCFPRCRGRTALHDGDADHSGLRIVGRRSAHRQRLGPVRSRQSEEPAAALLASCWRKPKRPATTRVLIDTSPDLREQMLSAGVGEIDGVLFTHEHADHTHGIDELRGFYLRQRRRVPVWADEPTRPCSSGRFAYCFYTAPGSDYPPILMPNRIVPGREVAIAGAGGTIRPCPSRFITAISRRSGFASATPPIRRTSTAFRRRACRSFGSRPVDRRCLEAHPASEPFQPGRNAAGSRGSSRGGRS